MDDTRSDQGWEELRAHIEKFLGQTLRTDAQHIEYKPRFDSGLPALTPDRPQKNGKRMNVS